MSLGFWRGTVNRYNGVTASSSLGDLVDDISLHTVGIVNFNKVSRVLVDWDLFTQLESSASPIQAPPEPWCIGVSYTPNPDGSPDLNQDQPVGMLTGDALFSALLNWEPVPWTDGTIHATQWHARSTLVASQKAVRTIFDVTTAVLHFGIQSCVSVLPGPFDYVALTVHGTVRLKYLID